jgi:uncharacterized protein (DUF427 family)
MNPAPGFKKFPGHRVTTQPSRAHVVVTLKGEVIAETRDAVELHESQSSSHVLAPVVYYVPRKDVKMERLARTSHKTHCPFKGDASYFSVVGGAENAVWSEQPYDEMAASRGCWRSIRTSSRSSRLEALLFGAALSRLR